MPSSIGISTCWRSRSIKDGRELAIETARLGVSEMELDFRLTPGALRDVLRTLKDLGVSPVSIHGICPAPENKRYEKGAEAFELCAADEDERRRGVADAVSTMRLASDIGARAVIFHLGSVPMERAEPELQRLYAAGMTHSPKGQRIINDLKIKRLAIRGNTFDQLLKSLEELAAQAEKLGVLIGLENRYHMGEYPNFEELAIIFSRFSPGPLRYWHDTGHAAAQENMGVAAHEAYLREFGDILLGVHLHDVDGCTDHQAPPAGGESGVDFSMVARYLKPDTLRILELNDGFSFDRVKGAIGWLAQRGIS